MTRIIGGQPLLAQQIGEIDDFLPAYDQADWNQIVLLIHQSNIDEIEGDVFVNYNTLIVLEQSHSLVEHSLWPATSAVSSASMPSPGCLNAKLRLDNLAIPIANELLKRCQYSFGSVPCNRIPSGTTIIANWTLISHSGWAADQR